MGEVDFHAGGEHGRARRPDRHGRLGKGQAVAFQVFGDVTGSGMVLTVPHAISPATYLVRLVGLVGQAGVGYRGRVLQGGGLGRAEVVQARIDLRIHSGDEAGGH